MAILPNASNFVLSNCHLVEHNVAGGGKSILLRHEYVAGIDKYKGLGILHDASLPDAAHDSAARESILYSIPKTQYEDFVDEFISWVRQADTPFSVMYLSGPKSTLAQMCAEKLGEQLAATFFFSRAHGIDDPWRFFTTLASQFVTHFPSYAALLDAKLRRNPALVSKSLKVQFQELIAAPFQELLAQGVDLGLRLRRVVIVEGIGECEDVEARCEIMRIILESAGLLGFRWAIFSERDHQLEAKLAERGLPMESCWRVDHSGLGSSDRVHELNGIITIRSHPTIIMYSTKIVASTAFLLIKMLALLITLVKAEIEKHDGDGITSQDPDINHIRLVDDES